MNSARPPAALIDLLKAVRKRLLRERWLTANVWALAAAGLAFGAGSLFGLRPTWLLALTTLGAFCAVALGSAYGSSRRRRLSQPVLARLAEGALGLKQRFSTTLETSAAAGPVTAALHREAAGLAAAANAAEIAPTRRPMRGLAALLVGTVAAFAGTLAPGAALETLRTAAPQPTRPAEVSVERVVTLAESVAAAAAESSDPLLGALAEALKSLAREAQSSGSDVITDRAGLEDLLGTLASAMGASLTGEQFAAGLSEHGPLADGFTPLTGDQSSEARLPLPIDDTTMVEIDDLNDLMARLDNTMNPSVPGPAQSDETGGNVQREPGTVSTDYLAGARQTLGEQGQDQGPTDAAAAIIGASSDATAGASQLAGQGSQQLDGDPGQAAEAEEADLVALAGKVRAEGRQVEMELAPTEGLGGADAGQLSLGAWGPTREAMIKTEDLPVRYRAVAGRYFLPPQDTAGAADGGS